MKRKIVQIAFEVEGDISTGEYSDAVSGSIHSIIYALADDGSIWFRTRGVGSQWVLDDDGVLPDIDLEEKTK